MFKMEEPNYSERLVSVYRPNQNHNPKYHNVNYTTASVVEKKIKAVSGVLNLSIFLPKIC